MLKLLDKVAIYALIDPETKDCMYIGQTQHPKKRERYHQYIVGKSSLIFQVLLYADIRDANKIEISLIESFQEMGLAKLNKAIGGHYSNRRQLFI